MTRVRDCFSSPAVTQPPSATLEELVDLLSTRAISALPIVEGPKLVGIVTSTDLVRATGAHDRASLTAAQVMRARVHTVGPDESAEEAARRLARARVHRLVVTEGERVVGVVSARDLLSAMKAMKIADPIAKLMTVDLRTVDIGDPIEDAIEKLIESNVHGLIVVDGRWPVGVFTQAEALAARRLPRELRARPVEEEMSYETICLDQSTPVYRAAAYFASLDARRILVVHDRELVGVLSGIDLLRAYAA